MTAAPIGDLQIVSDMTDVSTADGTADAFFTRPATGGPYPGVVLYMDAYGIRPALEAHAERLAGHGYCVLAPNVFYRSGRSPVAENIEQLIRAEDRGPLWRCSAPRWRR